MLLNQLKKEEINYARLFTECYSNTPSCVHALKMISSYCDSGLGHMTCFWPCGTSGDLESPCTLEFCQSCFSPELQDFVKKPSLPLRCIGLSSALSPDHPTYLLLDVNVRPSRTIQPQPCQPSPEFPSWPMDSEEINGWFSHKFLCYLKQINN